MSSIRKIFVMLLFISVSCDEPETLVTNIINRDGSVTRRIEMRNIKNDFSPGKIQVPYDSTWNVKDTIELNDKGDTTWVRTAEKLFNNADDINILYSEDQGSNKKASRQISFSRKFNWFNTSFRFSEKVASDLKYGYPLEDYLNEEELQYFYSPSSLNDDRMIGPDSLKYKALSDTIDKKTEKWMINSLISEWIGLFGQLAVNRGDDSVAAALRSKEKEIQRLYYQNSEKFDSLVESGALLGNLIGKVNAERFRSEADSALSMTDESWLNFADYTVQAVLPGKLTGTNGFSNSRKVLLWPVRGELFMTQDYEMWAESVVQNVWAWVITGLFLIFVLAGVVIRVIKKG